MVTKITKEQIEAAKKKTKYTLHNPLHEHCKDLLFIDASQDYQPSKIQNALMDEHMENILNAYEAREEVEKYAHLASYVELKKTTST